MPDEHLPGYGLDQYELDGVFEDVMQQRLATTTESRTDKISRLANEVCAQLQQRIPVINRGWAYKHEIGDRCMSFQEFDAHSTPSRDRKIAKTLTYLLYATNGAETASLDTTAEQLDASCSQLQLLDGTSLSAATFAGALMNSPEPLSDPNQPPAVRWGLEKGLALGCKQFY